MGGTRFSDVAYFKNCQKDSKIVNKILYYRQPGLQSTMYVSSQFTYLVVGFKKLIFNTIITGEW